MCIMKQLSLLQRYKNFNIFNQLKCFQRLNETWFGNIPVNESTKQNLVNNVFSNVSQKYDVMNDCMSLGLHRHWKNYFVSKILPYTYGIHFDVAGGTGDVAFELYKQIVIKKRWPKSQIYICDINKNMINEAKKIEKATFSNPSIEYIISNGQNLPVFDKSVDSYSIAFGIRNFGSIQDGLNEAYRILKPGGRFFCMEFSKVENFPIFDELYKFYSKQIIPVMGEIIAGDFASYDYLIKSIEKFPDQVQFGAMIENAGFEDVDYENVLFGAIAIHSGVKG